MRGRRDDEGTREENHLDGGGPAFSLPEEVIFDVLSRLPLCRFRCVSKAWRSLISDPAFAAARSSRVARPLVVGVFGKPRPLEKFYPPRPPRFPQSSLELRVMDTSDGSVLRVVKDVNSTKLMRTRLDLIFVDQGVHGSRMIDPANGRVVTVHGLEYPTADHNGIPYYALHAQFCHSSFGRATPSGTYKVVHLRDAFTVHGDSQVCQVATLEDDVEPTWRQRPEPPFLTCCCSSCTATVDGTLHFMDRSAPAHRTCPGPPGWNRIAAFDLESEKWKTMVDGPPIGYPNKEETWEMGLAELKKDGNF
ncbi:hypothetical protein QOZ80_2AG0132200 [Eleusine coracana subsp. coracana]|nr:hypothetical protein QOZ80_2AG0132200 [Eleusine coracana subsp. coracana]